MVLILCLILFLAWGGTYFAPQSPWKGNGTMHLLLLGAGCLLAYKLLGGHISF